mmetsp:Transcript_10870/g.21497  ORF Transcript_10870/g.21497 Transcript_10870/m.21497 type:complete len:357 (+) Transcript_10870:64-1134(+)
MAWDALEFAAYPFELAVILVVAFLSTIFLILHCLNEIRVRYNPPPSLHREREILRIRVGIICYNAIAMFLYLPVAFTQLQPSTDRDITECRIAVGGGFLAYNLLNVLLYRLLLDKTYLVDHQSHCLGLKKAMYFFLYFMFFPLVAIAVCLPFWYVAVVGRIETIAGGQYCCGYIPAPLITLMAITDSGYSLTLLGMFVYPLAHPARSESVERNKKVIARTAWYTALAVLSTILFLTLGVYLDLQYGIIIQRITSTAATLDLSVNLFSINMTWDPKYYLLVLRHYFPSLERESRPTPHSVAQSYEVKSSRSPKLEMGLVSKKHSIVRKTPLSPWESELKSTRETRASIIGHWRQNEV